MTRSPSTAWTSRGLARSPTKVVAACAAVLLSCVEGGGGRGRSADGRDPELAIWVSPIVRWGPGEPRELRFAIENASNRTVLLAGPDPAMARVDVYAGPENDRVCGTAPPPGTPARGAAVTLAPGDRITVRVDLETACGGVPAGEYRFAVTYRAPPSGRDAKASDAKLWAGALRARYGTVLVERGTAAARTPSGRSPRPERRRAGVERDAERRLR